jgi:hypothetical protein
VARHVRDGTGIAEVLRSETWPEDALKFAHPRRALLGTPLVGLLFALAGCPEPEIGPPGGAGPGGSDGTPCWDLDGDGTGDPAYEDTNGDGVVDLMDCQGPPGPSGEDGEDGEDSQTPYSTYAGVGACGDCHGEQIDRVARSGHANALLHTAGAEPEEPWADLGDYGGYPDEPPPGRDWSEVEYLVGGWTWMQRYVDSDGYVLTGADTQWNLESTTWSDYRPEDPAGTVSADCGQCHTTGYRADGNQGGLPGLVGTWETDGVQCEACHGPASLHVEEPYLVEQAVDRSAEACGKCHSLGDPSVIQAADGFILHIQQWNEMFASKKHVMGCVDCHDPHQSARYSDDTINPDRGLRVACEDCHMHEATVQNSLYMAPPYVECIDCHMPLATVAAAGDLATYTGDVRTHLFGIHPDADAEQFDETGTVSMPYLSLDYACRSCHDTWALPKTDEELEALAVGFHTAQIESS